MKNLFTTLLATAAIVGGAFTANAEVYDLQLDQPLTVPRYKKAEIVFRAQESGIITITNTTNETFAVYHPYEEGKEYSNDPEVDPTYPINRLSTYPWIISMEVEAGESYLLLAGFPMQESTLTATKGISDPEVKSIEPEPGTAMPITGSVQFEAKFNHNTVKAEKCVVTCGTQSAELSVK